MRWPRLRWNASTSAARRCRSVSLAAMLVAWMETGVGRSDMGLLQLIAVLRLAPFAAADQGEAVLVGYVGVAGLQGVLPVAPGGGEGDVVLFHEPIDARTDLAAEIRGEGAAGAVRLDQHLVAGGGLHVHLAALALPHHPQRGAAGAQQGVQVVEEVAGEQGGG